MSSMKVELRDAELAEHLARSLSDFEFEMLLRRRIEIAYGLCVEHNPEFTESYAGCQFTFEWNDKCNWHVRVGTCYKDSVSGDGEVLSMTFSNAVENYDNQRENKLSLLLPAPKPTVFE
jgi:hypothetical protein